MRVLALIWVIGSLIFSIAATFLQIEPTASIIEFSRSSDGGVLVIFPIGITFIICMAPLFLIFFINNRVQNRKNKVPSDLTGKTGVTIKRERELQNGALMYGVFINDSPVKKIGTGKKIFIELPPGNYQLQIKANNKIVSPIATFELIQGKILAYSTKADFSKSLTTLVPKGEMLFLVQVPYS